MLGLGLTSLITSSQPAKKQSTEGLRGSLNEYQSLGKTLLRLRIGSPITPGVPPRKTPTR
jgi:hypothetical protein